MMTSFAFILGLLPSVIATGPGAAGRREIGTSVFYGMLASAVMGVFVIPMLYVVFQWLREKTGWRPPKKLIPKRERAPPLARMRCHPMAVTSGPPNGSFGSRAAVVVRLTVRPVCPQVRKCRVRRDCYAWCQFRTSC
jgi:AcrB/AcrD/AcrF family